MIVSDHGTYITRFDGIYAPRDAHFKKGNPMGLTEHIESKKPWAILSIETPQKNGIPVPLHRIQKVSEIALERQFKKLEKTIVSKFGTELLSHDISDFPISLPQSIYFLYQSESKEKMLRFNLDSQGLNLWHSNLLNRFTSGEFDDKPDQKWKIYFLLELLSEEANNLRIDEIQKSKAIFDSSMPDHQTTFL